MENKREESRPYRIVVHNVEVNKEIIQEILRLELGDDVTLLEWHTENEIHYIGEGLVAGHPQRDSIVRLTYTI